MIFFNTAKKEKEKEILIIDFDRTSTKFFYALSTSANYARVALKKAKIAFDGFFSLSSNLLHVFLPT